MSETDPRTHFLLFLLLQAHSNNGGGTTPTSATKANGDARPKFVAATSLEDVQAIRTAEFHPQGKFYAVGSNSRTLRICAYPTLTDVRLVAWFERRPGS